MANLKLKKTILEVVDNQLKANDPPCTKEVYEKLQDAGYSKSEAKDKIGAVVLAEIYENVKEGKPFDEENYKNCLEEMLQQSIDYTDNHHIETEWDQWDDLVQAGYDYIDRNKPVEGLPLWDSAWQVFLTIMEQNTKTYTLHDLMEETDYQYPVDGWFQDYEMELGNARRYEDRIKFCQKVLEIFDWREEDDSCFQCGIGESLSSEGKKAEAYAHYEKWLKENPQNPNGVSSFSWVLSENGDTERAYEVVKDAIWGATCHVENAFPYMRAKELAVAAGKQDECQWYQQQLDKFEKSLSKGKGGIPVVKEKKIYPNDPCPCGSGKKYKKCCGKQ